MTESKWISVNEQLPPINEMVITKDQWKHVESGCYIGGTNYEGNPQFENDRVPPDDLNYIKWWMPDSPISD